MTEPKVLPQKAFTHCPATCGTPYLFFYNSLDTQGSMLVHKPTKVRNWTIHGELFILVALRVVWRHVIFLPYTLFFRNTLTSGILRRTIPYTQKEVHMTFLAAELPSSNSGGPSVHFERVGDAIVAQFIARKTGLKTTIGDDQSVTDVYVVNSNIPGIEKGTNASIWEGTHVKQLMADAGLMEGDGFVLRFVELKKKFKKFGFMRLNPEDLADEAVEAGVKLAFDSGRF